jgi:uncharacterized protein (DUF885 family)
MKTTLLVGICAVVLSACGGSSKNTPAVNNPPPVGPTAAEQFAADLQGLSLADFFDTSFEVLSRRSPETIIWRSLSSLYPSNEALLDDLSDDFQRDTFEMYQVALDALRSYDRSVLDAEGQLNFDVYEWQLQDVADRADFLYHGFPATYSIFGVQEETRQLFTEVHPLQTLQDAEDYIARLNRVGVKFTQLAEHLQLQRQAGVVEPALTMQVAINQVQAMAQGSAALNPYYTNFVTKIAAIPGITSGQRDDLEDRAFTAVDRVVKNAYQQLLQTLQGLLNNAPPSIGVGQYDRGSDYYDYALRHHTTTDMTPAEIHQLGLDELVRIHAEMRLVFDQLGYPQNETLQQLFARVQVGGGIIPAASVLSTYETIIDLAEQNVDAVFDIFPSADVVVIPDDFGGFYIGPSADGTRPGAFYAGTTTDQPWFQMRSLSYHEAVPGHHTQIAIAMDQDLPVFRKVGRATAFVEGLWIRAFTALIGRSIRPRSSMQKALEHLSVHPGVRQGVIAYGQARQRPTWWECCRSCRNVREPWMRSAHSLISRASIAPCSPMVHCRWHSWTRLWTSTSRTLSPHPENPLPQTAEGSGQAVFGLQLPKLIWALTPISLGLRGMIRRLSIEPFTAWSKSVPFDIVTGVSSSVMLLA